MTHLPFSLASASASALAGFFAFTAPAMAADTGDYRPDSAVIQLGVALGAARIPWVPRTLQMVFGKDEHLGVRVLTRQDPNLLAEFFRRRDSDGLYQCERQIRGHVAAIPSQRACKRQVP